MILDEQDLLKTFSKADNFTAIGLAVGASAANAFTAGVAVTSIATTVVGAGVTAYGQAQQGKAANAIAQRNAKIQNNNALIASQNAEFNARLKERDDKRRRASMRTKLSASGVQVFDGTNLIALAEQEFTDDLNAQLIRRGGAIDSANLRQQAGITSAKGQVAQSAGNVGAGASLLTGFGEAGTTYATQKRQGVFG